MDPVSLYSGLLPPPDTRAAREPGEEGRAFEQLLVGMLVKELRRAMPEDGLLGSREAAVFQDMLDRELSARIASGSGLGIAREISGLPRGSMRPADRLPVDGVLSSGFGERVDPLGAGRRMHDGIDLAAPEGSPVRAVRSGVVSFAGERRGYGRVVVLDHGGGLQTRYAHCSSLEVAAGQHVRAGDTVGRVGNTGRSTGPHLHFEVRRRGRALDPETTFGWRLGDRAKGS